MEQISLVLKGKRSVGALRQKGSLPPSGAIAPSGAWLCGELDTVSPDEAAGYDCQRHRTQFTSMAGLPGV